MSFMQNLKKGLFGEDDGYDDQYIDDGPQMVNNNSGFGSSDSYDEDSGDSSKKRQPGGQHQRHHPAQGGPGQARAVLRTPAPSPTI